MAEEKVTQAAEEAVETAEKASPEKKTEKKPAAKKLAAEKKADEPKAEKKPAASKASAKKADAEDEAEVKKPAVKKVSAGKAGAGDKAEDKKTEKKPAEKKAPSRKATGKTVVIKSEAKAKKQDKAPAKGQVKITLRRALAGRTKAQIAVAESLGLRRVGDVTIQPDNAATTGKIKKIVFLLDIAQA